MNKQRESIYTLRREILEGRIRVAEDEIVDTRAYLMSLAEDLLDAALDTLLRRETGARRAVGPRGPAPGGGARSSASTRPTSPRVGFAGKTAGEIRDALWERIAKQVRGEGAARRRRPPAARRARHHAADRRRAVEGPPLQPRPPEGRHRPARLRPARSARRVQEGELRALPGHEGPRSTRRSVRYLWWLRPVASDEAPPAARRPARPRGPRRSATNDAAASAAARASAARAGAARRRRRPARRPAPAATTPSRPCGATSRRSAATTRARAAAARSTRSATAPPPDLRGPHGTQDRDALRCSGDDAELADGPHLRRRPAGPAALDGPADARST